MSRLLMKLTRAAIRLADKRMPREEFLARELAQLEKEELDTREINNFHPSVFEGTASIKSNEATEAAIDSIYYAKEEFMGNAAYAEWAKSLDKADKNDLRDALDKGLTTKELEEALEADPTGTTALELVATKLDA